MTRPRFLVAFAAAAIAVTPASGQAPAKPLFADNSTIQLSLAAPLSVIARNASRDNRPVAGTMTVAGTAEAIPVQLSARGITRRLRETCTFPPLRVDVAGQVPAGSLFAGQRRLKLVTHCRDYKQFQKHVLLEYAAYRLYNVLTPNSFRVRLAQIDYRTDGGKPVTSRLGFFIEDGDDVGARIGLREAKLPARIPVSILRSADAGRMAVFEYMISNLDWAMNGGPPGEECCHNSRLYAAPGATRDIVVVPYDFDYSGLVDAPYAVAPSELRVNNVRQRRYHGYCSYNAEALAAAAEMRARRGELLAVLGQIPELDGKARSEAVDYLSGFFDKVATDADVRKNLLVDCVR